MNKILLILTALFYIFSLNVNADTINKITISGNKRISDETIKVLGDIYDKSEIEKDDLNDLLKRLYDTNFFKDAYDTDSFEHDSVMILKICFWSDRRVRHTFLMKSI